MVGAPYYRSEADRCRKRAADDPSSESAKRWLQLAAEYEQLADALETETETEAGAAQPRAQRSPMQQQPMQQQQSKAEPEDDT